ncbi:unnamed protein product [Aspergillus oryzae var. brunneus]|uniref:Unnamed protein product n=2 Tax=Aspergillus oryzae TaxID=5062 RepID=A0AAN4YD12_ASPOZ|nr:unnamed protein product [Aspergillus oryzae]GMG02709.1 unnamed protein product [Aspergillus oryzae]GMG27421.1 unnamed protein product [Aspergillus oryzae]GMG40928.1 unnamed protein product [Aspergillus oryzae var. brunneus]
MGLPKLKLPRANADRAYKDEPDPRPSDAVLRQSANGDDGLVDTKIPFLTFRSFSMCVVISMGGFLFGYDTGQISGFLEMEDFLQRYGEQRADGTYYFSNVRSGLIVALVLTYIWAIILGFGISMFPESPRHDYRKGKVDKAISTLAKMYGVPKNHRALAIEFDEIKQKYEEEVARGQVSWIQLFKAPRMAYRVAVGVALQALQQLTGANYFFYYGTTIFQGAGIENSYVTQMILGAVNFGSTFLGLYLIENYGRRRSLIAGALWMFCCFIVFASVGHFSLNRDDPPSTKTAGVVMVVFACLFILAFASTWGPMVWTIIAELYPSEYRARAMSLATASNWLWNFLLAFFTPFITSAIDFRYGYVFAGCLFLAAGLVYFAVMEGKGRTLEEIDTMYVWKVKPWHSSKYVFPETEPSIMEKRRASHASNPSTNPTTIDDNHETTV